MTRTKIQALLAAALLCGSLATPLAGCGNSSSSQSSSSQQSSSQQDATSSSSSDTTDAASSSSTSDKDTSSSSSTSGSDSAQATIPNGTYSIKVDTDSSMFRADSCSLKVEDGTYTATLVLPGEGFSRLYFGTAEEAQNATDGIYTYYILDGIDKYAFDIPVEALDKELTIAAYGQRRDTWYDHTITFHAPDPNDESVKIESTYPDVA